MRLKVLHHSLQLQPNSASDAEDKDNRHINNILGIWPAALDAQHLMPLLRDPMAVRRELNQLCTRTRVLVFRQHRHFNAICAGPKVAAFRNSIKAIVLDVQDPCRAQRLGYLSGSASSLRPTQALAMIKNACDKFKQLETITLVVNAAWEREIACGILHFVSSSMSAEEIEALLRKVGICVFREGHVERFQAAKLCFCAAYEGEAFPECDHCRRRTIVGAAAEGVKTVKWEEV